MRSFSLKYYKYEYILFAAVWNKDENSSIWFVKQPQIKCCKMSLMCFDAFNSVNRNLHARMNQTLNYCSILRLLFFYYVIRHKLWLQCAHAYRIPPIDCFRIMSKSRFIAKLKSMSVHLMYEIHFQTHR